MVSDKLPGLAYPLGATIRPDGVNFSLFSKHSTAVELLLFDQPGDPQPQRVIRLDPQINKTFYYWHVFVPGLEAGQVYGYRVFGPYNPNRGDRFDGSKVLVDPYTRAVIYDGFYDREAAKRPGDNCAHAMKSVVVDPRSYQWEGDVPLCRPFAHSVIYELHVGGFTRHPNSGVEPAFRGTYSGLVQKIPYLQSLGITAVELLPVQQFDEQSAAPGLSNYWGYNTVAFFAPHCGYSSQRDPLGVVNEFRDMVKALHRSGIEVILDIVFNHTAEGDEEGPTLSFRGLENRAYYILESNRAVYANYTGCGNTVNGNHSIVRRLIMDCLRYWVQEMHVDGFRFDLAATMARDESGQILKSPPILWEIESDPVLASTKIIAEAWDAAGLNQVGRFIGNRWAEWNGCFRDDLRHFVRTDNQSVRSLASRILASPDIYPFADRDPNRSINFITCHDGFTLYDLVSYEKKHNQANLENSRDGSDNNLSWNCGVEGNTKNPGILALRQKQMKNLLTALFVSQGTPMILMGDEVCRTQKGNNNAYCQDNKISWFDWNGLKRNPDMLRFVQRLISFSQGCQLLQEERFWNGCEGETSQIKWHGIRLNQPDWGDDSHSLAFELQAPINGSGANGPGGGVEHLYVIFNAYWEDLPFDLPFAGKDMSWHRVVDTSLASPEDISELGSEPVVSGGFYPASARSAVILIAR